MWCISQFYYIYSVATNYLLSAAYLLSILLTLSPLFLLVAKVTLHSLIFNILKLQSLIFQKQPRNVRRYVTCKNIYKKTDINALYFLFLADHEKVNTVAINQSDISLHRTTQAGSATEYLPTDNLITFFEIKGFSSYQMNYTNWTESPMYKRDSIKAPQKHKNIPV